MRLTRLSARAFNSAARRTGLEPDSVAMARRHLVDGATQGTVAAEFNRSQQFVYKVVEKIRRASEQAGVADDGWVTVELPLPGVLSAELMELAQALADCKSQQHRDAAIAILKRSLSRASLALQTKRAPGADKA